MTHMEISTLLSVAQIVISIIVIILILLQERSSGLGGILGGGGEGEFYASRRGLEKIIFGATIILVILFAALSLIQLVL